MNLLKHIKFFLGGEPEDVTDKVKRPNITLSKEDFEEWAYDVGFDLSTNCIGQYEVDETDAAYDGFCAAYLEIQDKIDRGEY